MTCRRRVIASAVTCILVLASLAEAMSGTDTIRRAVTPADAAALGWPDGSLPLMNDPLRLEGYHPWFSELPNASYHFAYRVGSTDDANRLIKLLAAVAGPQRILELSPLKAEASKPVYVRQPDDDKVSAATRARLSMDSQPTLDNWYKHLTPEGQKKFRAYERPKAAPPTLALFVGDRTVDLTKLQVPPTVTLRSGVTAWDRQDPALRQEVERVEGYVRDRGGAVPPPATRPATQRGVNPVGG